MYTDSPNETLTELKILVPRSTTTPFFTCLNRSVSISSSISLLSCVNLFTFVTFLWIPSPKLFLCTILSSPSIHLPCSSLVSIRSLTLFFHCPQYAVSRLLVSCRCIPHLFHRSP